MGGWQMKASEIEGEVEGEREVDACNACDWDAE